MSEDRYLSEWGDDGTMPGDESQADADQRAAELLHAAYLEGGTSS